MANNNIEIEIKIPLTENKFFEIKKKLEKISNFVKKSNQIDEYFTPSHRNFVEPKFPFEWLREVAWDNFFECCYDEIDITYEDALKLRNYLIHIAKRELEELKKILPFIE